MRSELLQTFPFGRAENGKDDVDFFKCKFNVLQKATKIVRLICKLFDVTVTLFSEQHSSVFRIYRCLFAVHTLHV